MPRRWPFPQDQKKTCRLCEKVHIEAGNIWNSWNIYIPIIFRKVSNHCDERGQAGQFLRQTVNDATPLGHSVQDSLMTVSSHVHDQRGNGTANF